MKVRSAIARTVCVALGASALAWLATAGGLSGGSAPDRATAMKAIADEGPGYAVEDFGYPNADKILAEQGITLKRGDGHILLADCASGTDLLQVMTREQSSLICFRVTGSSGYLALEIPAVHAVKGNNYATQVDMTAGEESKSFDITKNKWTGVGESADPEGRDFMLMEIRTAATQ
ncbi:hypothetical protein ACIQV3_40260 [Streptomyces sp. NPDC099050]|uniref:hypothetical protein n=1 Tax=Streptomyces sp. NPDC099050 TaxID=3366100 RepID=UPI00381AFAA0